MYLFRIKSIAGPRAPRLLLLAALAMATSWEAWNVLRTIEECSVARARRVLVRTMTRLLAGA